MSNEGIRAMSNKEAILEVVRSLSDEATMEEIVEEVQVLASIRRGQEAIAQGRFVTHEEARTRLDQWLSK